jgi:hypothetical protein
MNIVFGRIVSAVQTVDDIPVIVYSDSLSVDNAFRQETKLQVSEFRGSKFQESMSKRLP